jgi:hypothetical protein
MNPHQVLITLAALAGVGLLTALGYARSASRRATRGLRDATRATGSLVRTLVAAAAITGIEWVAATSAHDWRVLVAVLGVPALLAGRTIARMFAVTEFLTGQGGYRR